jgi:hypothetical protein
MNHSKNQLTDSLSRASTQIPNHSKNQLTEPIKADNGVTVNTLIYTVCENRFATDKMPSCL